MDSEEKVQKYKEIVNKNKQKFIDTIETLCMPGIWGESIIGSYTGKFVVYKEKSFTTPTKEFYDKMVDYYMETLMLIPSIVEILKDDGWSIRTDVEPYEVLKLSYKGYEYNNVAFYIGEKGYYFNYLDPKYRKEGTNYVCLYLGGYGDPQDDEEEDFELYVCNIFPVLQEACLNVEMMNAFKEAEKIVNAKTIRPLQTNNILDTKEKVRNQLRKIDFSKLKFIDGYQTYSFTGNVEGKNIEYILTGNADFARSFTTAEYFLSTIGENKYIDYSIIIMDYIKSVEQLLSTIFYNNMNPKGFILAKNNTDPSEFNDPADLKIGTNHKKIKTIPEYVDRFETNLSSLSEYVIYYLPNLWNDNKNPNYKAIFGAFIKHNRNGYFHIDNIYEDEEVNTIRNNTIFILYSLLSELNLPDRSILSLSDNEYNKLYLRIYKEIFFYKSIIDIEGIKGDPEFAFVYKNNIMYGHVKIEKPKYNKNGDIISRIHIKENENYYISPSGEKPYYVYRLSLFGDKINRIFSRVPLQERNEKILLEKIRNKETKR